MKSLLWLDSSTSGVTLWPPYGFSSFCIRRLPQLTAALELVNEISRQLTDRKNEAVTEISNTFEELEKALHQRKTALITDLENICSTKQKVKSLDHSKKKKKSGIIYSHWTQILFYFIIFIFQGASAVIILTVVAGAAGPTHCITAREGEHPEQL